MLLSLKASQNTMINDRHCFECYGYDIIIDSALKPWLIEVNASPSLTSTTTKDRVMKHGILNDILNIVAPEGIVEARRTTAEARFGPRVPVPRVSGGFQLLYDESEEAEAQAKQLKQSMGSRRPTNQWR